MNHSPATELERTIREKLARTSTPALIHRMDQAPDFGYDDEAAELTRRLQATSREWAWTRDQHGRERVTVLTVATIPAGDIQNGDILILGDDAPYVVTAARRTLARVCLTLAPHDNPYTPRTRRITRAPHTPLTVRRPHATR